MFLTMDMGWWRRVCSHELSSPHPSLDKHHVHSVVSCQSVLLRLAWCTATKNLVPWLPSTCTWKFRRWSPHCDARADSGRIPAAQQLIIDVSYADFNLTEYRFTCLFVIPRCISILITMRWGKRPKPCCEQPWTKWVCGLLEAEGEVAFYGPKPISRSKQP